MDVIPGLSNILDDCNDPLMDTGTGETQPSVENVGGGSRFSQFFSKPKTEEKEEEQQQQQDFLQPSDLVWFLMRKILQKVSQSRQNAK